MIAWGTVAIISSLAMASDGKVPSPIDTRGEHVDTRPGDPIAIVTPAEPASVEHSNDENSVSITASNKSDTESTADQLASVNMVEEPPENATAQLSEVEEDQAADVTASPSDAEEDQVQNENPTVVLNSWLTSTKRSVITLVTAGKSGSGKSSLIASMLGLEGENAPKINHSPSSVSIEVEVFERKVNGITLRIVDTPGMGASDVEEARIISELQKATQGKADMLLYCVSMLPTSKIDKPDREIVKKLTYAFGEDCWKQSILVFTFANMVKKAKHKMVIEKYSEKFQEILRSVCTHIGHSFFSTEQYSIVPIFSCDQGKITRSPYDIIALPAGEDPDEEIIDGVRWDESIYMEVLKKCNPEAIPALLKVKGPTPKLIRLGLEIGGFTAFTGAVGAVGGVAGAVAGGIVGGAIGAGLGLLLGGIGAGPGAILGGKIGAGLVGGTCAVSGGLVAADDLFEYNAKQAECSKLREEIQEYEQHKKLKDE